jgi:hypothetical protein
MKKGADDFIGCLLLAVIGGLLTWGTSSLLDVNWYEGIVFLALFGLCIAFLICMANQGK